MAASTGNSISGLSRRLPQKLTLQLRWYPVPQREVDRRGGDRSLPMHTPTMAGGLFSIDKSYFYEIGSYDSGARNLQHVSIKFARNGYLGRREFGNVFPNLDVRRNCSYRNMQPRRSCFPKSNAIYFSWRNFANYQQK